MKYLLPFVLLINTAMAQDSDFIYSEVMGKYKKQKDFGFKYAMFPNGKNGLITFINSTIEYPKQATEKKIQGKVSIKYTVSKNGRITKVKIQKGESKILNQEAKRVIKSMNQWKPGKAHGKPIKLTYTQDFNFKLI